MDLLLSRMVNERKDRRRRRRRSEVATPPLRNKRGDFKKGHDERRNTDQGSVAAWNSDEKKSLEQKKRAWYQQPRNEARDAKKRKEKEQQNDTPSPPSSSPPGPYDNNHGAYDDDGVVMEDTWTGNTDKETGGSTRTPFSSMLDRAKRGLETLRHFRTTRLSFGLEDTSGGSDDDNFHSDGESPSFSDGCGANGGESAKKLSSFSDSDDDGSGGDTEGSDSDTGEGDRDEDKSGKDKMDPPEDDAPSNNDASRSNDDGNDNSEEDLFTRFHDLGDNFIKLFREKELLESQLNKKPTRGSKESEETNEKRRERLQQITNFLKESKKRYGNWMSPIFFAELYLDHQWPEHEDDDDDDDEDNEEEGLEVEWDELKDVSPNEVIVGTLKKKGGKKVSFVK